MREPSIGEKLYVRPRDPRHPVQELEDVYKRFLPNEWTLKEWNYWLHARWRDGSIEAKYPEPEKRDAIPTAPLDLTPTSDASPTPKG